MRQVQVRGCLPALLVLALLGALVALVISASLAVALPVAGVLLLAGLVRAAWYRVTGRSPPRPFGGATFRTVRVDGAWGGGTGPEGPEDGPVVDALPKAPRAALEDPREKSGPQG
jgi:hypothetical protein